MYAICKNNGKENEFEIWDYDEDKVSIDYHWNPSTGFRIKTNKGIKQVNQMSEMDIFKLFHPANTKFTMYPLTAFVYEQVEDDLGEVFGSKFKNLS